MCARRSVRREQSAFETLHHKLVGHRVGEVRSSFGRRGYDPEARSGHSCWRTGTTWATGVLEETRGKAQLVAVVMNLLEAINRLSLLRQLPEACAECG